MKTTHTRKHSVPDFNLHKRSTSKVKGGASFCSSSSSSRRSSHISGTKTGVPLPQDMRFSTICKTVDGIPIFEQSENAWGYLVKTGGNVYTLDRQLDSRSNDEAAGYYIGNFEEECDILINHFQPRIKIAFIHCRPKTKGDRQVMAVYIHNRSSQGIWVNFKRMTDTIVELSTSDVIHFMCPKRFGARVNPCYSFIKPITTTLTVEKFESLYKKGRKIGDGAFGEVHLGYCIATGEKVAIKEIPHSVHRSKPNFSVSLLREISVCMAFPVHPCIIQINKVFEVKDTTYIVMEYGASGDLFTNISEPALYLQEYEIKIVFDQIAHAISFLHEQDIVHRDIKLENVIMCDRKKLTAKLCDFGLSTFKTRDSQLYTVCGTIMYAAPELLEAGDTTIQQAAVAGYGPPVDIWSLGVLLFTALTNSTPFPQIDETEKGKAELKNCIRKGEFKFDNPIWKSISPEVQDLIKCMMRKNPAERYTVEQVLAHPWLENIETPITRAAGLTRNQELVEYLSKTKSNSSSPSISSLLL